MSVVRDHRTKLLILDELDDERLFCRRDQLRLVNPHVLIRSSSFCSILSRNRSMQQSRPNNSPSAESSTSQIRQSISSACSDQTLLSKTKSPPADAEHPQSFLHTEASAAVFDRHFTINNYGESIIVGGNIGTGTTLSFRHNRTPNPDCKPRTETPPAAAPVNSNGGQESSPAGDDAHDNNTRDRPQPRLDEVPDAQPDDPRGLSDTNLFVASPSDSFERSSVNGHILHYEQ